MPKMKTKSSAKKRFTKVASGLKVKVGRGYRRHLLTKKNRKTKRKLRQTGYICAADLRQVLRLLPY